MVFGCVSSEGDVMLPHFFREGFWLNSDGYVELLKTVVKPWVTRVAIVGRMYSRRIQFLATPLAPSHLPEKLLASYRLCLGQYLINKVKNGCLIIFIFSSNQMFGLQTHKSMTPWKFLYGAQLKKASITVPVGFEVLPKETVASACFRFQSRIEAVIDGDFFE